MAAIRMWLAQQALLLVGRHLHRATRRSLREYEMTRLRHGIRSAESTRAWARCDRYFRVLGRPGTTALGHGLLIAP